MFGFISAWSSPWPDREVSVLFSWKGITSWVTAAFLNPGKYNYTSPCWKHRVVLKPTSGVPSQAPPPFPHKECQGVSPATSDAEISDSPALAQHCGTSCCWGAGNSFPGGQALLRAASSPSPEPHTAGHTGPPGSVSSAWLLPALCPAAPSLLLRAHILPKGRLACLKYHLLNEAFAVSSEISDISSVV